MNQSNIDLLNMSISWCHSFQKSKTVNSTSSSILLSKINEVRIRKKKLSKLQQIKQTKQIKQNKHTFHYFFIRYFFCLNISKFKTKKLSEQLENEILFLSTELSMESKSDTASKTQILGLKKKTNTHTHTYKNTQTHTYAYTQNRYCYW